MGLQFQGIVELTRKIALKSLQLEITDKRNGNLAHRWKAVEWTAKIRYV